MGKFISLFSIYFFSILFLNYKIICDAYLPPNISELLSNENYYFESGTNYNFAESAASNFMNISISCNETLDKKTKMLGVLNFINCSNIVINASSCGDKLEIRPEITIEQESDISFVSVVFLPSAIIQSFDSSVQLLDCDINQLTETGNFIDGHDSHFFIKSLNTSNYASLQTLYFDSEDNPNSSLTLDSCDGNFNLIVDAVKTTLIDCAPLEMTIQNTNLSLNSSYIQINDLNLVNSYFEMINSSLKNLILSGNSSISGDTLNISESLSFVGDNSQLKVINASVYFNGTSFSSDETSVQIQKNFSIFSTTCTVQSTNLYLIVNNTNLQINYSISIKRIDFIGDTLLHGSAILQVSNQIFFNESGIKTIYSPLNILNLINSVTYSGNDNFIYLYNDFFIDTSLTSIQLPGIYSENNESILGLYSDTINTNYSIPFLEINGGNISGNNNFLIVEDNISFNGNSLIINNIQIDSQKTNFIENGIIQFQNSYLYSKSSKFQQDSNFTIFGNGLFFSQELNDEGILIIDNIFGGKNIQIQENGDLKLSNINSSNFQNSNVVLNGSLMIENSIISDPFDSLISNSANQFPLTIINSQISFSNNQFDFPSLQMINSSLTNLNSSLKDLFLEGNNALNISDITFQNGMIQMKENSNSFLDISSTNIKFGSYSGLELTSNSTLTIFSSDNSFLNFSFYDENNLTFSIPNDSLLKLENINIDIDGNSITDLSGNISVNQSILRIYNFQNGFIGVLNVIDSNSEVKLESDINIKILNLFKGKLSFTKISTTDNDSYLIFGDGTDQAIINEDSISESIIYSTTGGIIEINNNSIFDNVLFDIRNDSHLIIKTFNLTNSRYASKIKNHGYITINPYYVSLNNPKKDENCFEEELNYIYFNFSVINEENGIINCSENTQFNQLFSSSGLIQTSKNLVFENGLILNETGKIEISQIFSNSSLTSKSFVCNSESEISLSNSTFNTQEFLNNGTFLIDSSIFSSSINGYNYGNFSVNNSDVFFQKLESYGDFQFNNSNLTLNDNSFLNNTNNIFGISYFINSIIEIIDEKLLSFNGNYMIEDGGSILGEFKIEENSNITLLLEENNNTYLSINHQPQIQGKLYLNLLRYSEDQPRYYPYKAIYLLNSFNFSSEQLESNDEQFIEINQDENWIIAQVKGCKKGKYSNDFDQECKDCSEGEYNNETGATSCKKCPSGYISNQKGKEECEPCNEGYYQPNTGQSFCFECQPGTHAPHNGSDHCQECPGGEYNYNNASTTCEVCGAGNYSDNPTKCDFCPLGKYNPKEGSTLCYNCSIGTYSNQKGKTFCKACDVDTYQDEIGKESCKVCPENSETNGYGATSINDCVCSLGYYGIASKLCEVCPEGSLCNDIGIVIPYAKEGYWHSKADPTNYLECAVKEACPGGGTDICNKNIGYSGNLCAVCLKGFYKFGSQCMKCPNNQKNRLILVGLFIILLCLFLFIIARKIRNYFASFSIMFSFFQVLAVISGLKLNWPGSLETTWRSISLFNFNIDYLAVECSLQLSYTQKWILCMIFPFIILAVLLIVYLIAFLPF
ncbi:insulin-like growth factor binding proteinn-terminal [Anaeramoeba ignava]|uniref:Insulin-like growth factor binding proteinn-terminal n=1 Tax=Anaeramoeba ignava TaxID=1746090 RepID=A0A9Q0LSW1_ANAIG|nr:insulin-like growth factor binding proteinn-terminal [Anaeramoeba ignava]